MLVSWEFHFSFIIVIVKINIIIVIKTAITKTVSFNWIAVKMVKMDKITTIKKIIAVT